MKLSQSGPRMFAPLAALFAASLITLSAAFNSAQAAEDAAAKEQQLIEALRTAEPAEKALACKQLAIYGSAAAVPELAKLLADEHLASWSRIALEAIPGGAADEALRKAAESLQGKLLIGVINSIGVRRDAKAAELLAGQLKNENADVASAAAVALGHIGTAPATKSLREALAGPQSIRNAVAEGCILAAESLLAADKAGEAAELYDQVRKAEVPRQRQLEATRGAIVARKTEGIPLLVEQLQSNDKGLFQIGLTVARELPGREVANALAGELAKTTPQKAALLLYALADRKEPVDVPAILEVARSGEPPVRIAAIAVLGRSEDASSLSTLLDIAADPNAELARAAKTALAGLAGKQVNPEIVARLAKAEGKSLLALLELAGQRRIEATEPLVNALGHDDAAIRAAALTALGETVGPQQLKVLIGQVLSPKHKEDEPVALKALQAAAVRMPDREACATELAASFPRASVPTRAALLEVLGAMGGPKALATIATTMRGGDEQLQDAGSRVLGAWMSVEAAPVLLDLAKTASSDKYQVRALRGYIRLARQFTMPDAQRAEMCREALEAANRLEEQQLALAVLERYPNVDTLKVAVKATGTPELKSDATRVAMKIAQKVGGKSAEARDLLTKLGLEPVKLEIIKAEYGAGDKQKDVTDKLQKLAGDLPVVTLPTPNFNEAFGGDPAPGTIKQLKIKYTLNGQAAEATFEENAPITFPIPK